MSPETALTTRRSIAINQIAVDRIDGLAGRFEIQDLVPGVNVVFGPNACGKSRTAAAMQALLWPKALPEGAELRGVLSSTDKKWQVRCDDRSMTYIRDGSPVDGPNLTSTPFEQRDRYLLSLHDLLSSDNSQFAKVIRRESTGGYDLIAAAARLDLASAPPKPRPGSASKALVAAMQRSRELRASDHLLQEAERRLAGLVEQLEDARAAVARVPQIEAALEFQKSRDRLAEAEARLATFVEPIGRMTGDELKRLAALREKRSQVEHQRRDAELKRDQAATRVHATGFGDGLPLSDMIPALRSRLTRLTALRAELKSCEEAVATCRVARNNARERLGTEIDDAQIHTLDREGLKGLADAKRKLDRAQAIAEVQQTIEQWLGASTTLPDMDQLKLGIDLLTDRLGMELALRPQAPPTRVRAALISGAVIILVESFLLASEVAAPFLSLAVAGVILLVAAFRPVPSDANAEAEELQRRYVSLALEPITAWDAATIERVRALLRQQLTEAEVERTKAIKWDNLAAKRAEAEAAEHRAWEELEACNRELGVNLEHDPESLRGIADALASWRSASDELAKNETVAAQIQLNLANELSHVNDDLRKYGMGDARDDIEAEARINELERRISEASTALAERREQTNLIANQVQPQIDVLQLEEAELYMDLGLDLGDDRTLGNWSELVPACKEAQAAVNDARAQAEMAKARLADHPNLITLARDQLEELLANQQAVAATRDDLSAEIAKIRSSVDRAKQASTLEEAVLDEQRELGNLRVARDRVDAQTAGWELVSFVQKQSRDASRPRVFRVARDIFSAFTAGAFLLDLSEGSDPTFRATETANNNVLELDQLSSGTRIQLLMAVRLAFIEEMESGYQLPLLLDEVLGNTDDVRARAIIDATIEICKRGRQVVYFTAQQDEVAKWRARLQSTAPEVPLSVIDLGSIRGMAAAIEPTPLVWDSVAFEPIAVPDGTDRETAKQLLAVPPVDPWAKQIHGVDLWYLLTDVSTVAQLRELGIKVWGQLLNHDLDRLGRLVPPLTEEFARAELLSRALTAVLEAWRIGRTPPITRGAITASGVRLNAFTDDVLALAERCEWDGASLIRALRENEIARFRRATTDELEEALREQGYITDDAPMTAAEVRTRALSAVAKEIEQGTLTVQAVNELLLTIGAVTTEE